MTTRLWYVVRRPSGGWWANSGPYRVRCRTRAGACWKAWRMWRRRRARWAHQ